MEEKDEDLRQKEKSKMEGHGKRRSIKAMRVEDTEQIVTTTVTYQS